MTNAQLKNLKDRLWEGADQLRANSGLNSTDVCLDISVRYTNASSACSRSLVGGDE